MVKINKAFSYILFAALLLSSCTGNTVDEMNKTVTMKNEVLVFGMIHGKHLTEPEFGVDVLAQMIQQIDPDIILAEIPPDRFPAAITEFVEKDTITEPRVKRFPEYTHVIFPLLKEMHYEIVPTAGWTKPMAEARSAKLKAISQDSTRTEDWGRLTAAQAKSDSLIKATGREFDPYWINSDAYDAAVEIELSVYNELFNEELGPGGWDNINAAHYAHINDALDRFSGQGKRIVITYGAGHKGWFLKALQKRDDIELKTLEELTN